MKEERKEKEKEQGGRFEGKEDRLCTEIRQGSITVIDALVLG